MYLNEININMASNFFMSSVNLNLTYLYCDCVFSRPCVALDWDCYGDLLAAVCANASTLTLWDANTNKRSSVEVGLRDKLSCLVWAKTSPLLAVTSNSGNLSIYNHSTAK